MISGGSSRTPKTLKSWTKVASSSALTQAAQDKTNRKETKRARI
jgi:hypothetical protein